MEGPGPCREKKYVEDNVQNQTKVAQVVAPTSCSPHHSQAAPKKVPLADATNTATLKSSKVDAASAITTAAFGAAPVRSPGLTKGASTPKVRSEWAQNNSLIKSTSQISCLPMPLFLVPPPLEIRLSDWRGVCRVCHEVSQVPVGGCPAPPRFFGPGGRMCASAGLPPCRGGGRAHHTANWAK